MQFFSADFIFDGFQFLPSDSIIILDDMGIISGVTQATNQSNVIHLNGLLMPGLINAHCHLELSHMKDVIKEKTGLVEFLLRINQQRAIHTEEEIKKAIHNAEHEMLQNGIVAVGDISNTLLSFEQKRQKNLHYHTFVECVGLLNANAHRRFEAAEKMYNEFIQLHESSLVVHAPYSVSENLMALIDQASIRKITSIHNQECDDENRLFQNGDGNFLKLFESILHDSTFFKPSGKTSLQTYFPKFHHQQKLILVHNTVSSKEDIEFANSFEKELFWCLCPNANLYIEQKLPDVLMMMEQGCQMVLGTDSLASNHSLSILDEILTLQHHIPSISLHEKLTWATSNGAKALGMHELGSFETGKKPGLIQIENVVSSEQLPEKPEVKIVKVLAC